MKLLKILLVLLILCPPQSKAGTVSVQLDYETHRKGGASKTEGGDLLTRTEALKKETKASYRRIDSLIDSDEPNAGLFMEQALQKKKDLNQLRSLRKQLKETCKFSKEELESCKVRVKDNEGKDGYQTDSSDEDNMSREDQAFNRGALKGIGEGMIEALKGSVEGLYHLITDTEATIEGIVAFFENIDELPGLLAASLEELEGMDPEQQGEAIAKFITEQVFTFYNPVSKTKLLQQASKTKLGAAAVKVGAKTGDKLGKLARKYGLNYSSATTRQLLENFDMKATDWIGKYRKGNIKSVLKDVGDKTIGQIFDSADSQTRKLILDSRFAK